jgi:acyl carrier protein
MNSPTEEIRQVVRTYILNEFLPGERPESLTNQTALITGGILNSIATVKLVTFLEDRYAVEFETHELTGEYLNTVDDITNAVASKMAK